MKRTIARLAFVFLLLTANASAQSTSSAQNASDQKLNSLWTKLESTINEVDRNLDGVLGVAIEDLTTGQKFLLHGDSIFPKPVPSRSLSSQSFITRRSYPPKAHQARPN